MTTEKEEEDKVEASMKATADLLARPVPFGGLQMPFGGFQGIAPMFGQDEKAVIASQHFQESMHRLHLRGRLGEAYIVEQGRTKRFSLILGGAVAISAVALLAYPPNGRELLSWVLGGVLLLGSAAIVTYSVVHEKTEITELLRSLE